MPSSTLVLYQQNCIQRSGKTLHTTVSVTNGVGVHPRGGAADSLGLQLENVLSLETINCDRKEDLNNEGCHIFVPSTLNGPEGFIIAEAV